MTNLTGFNANNIEPLDEFDLIAPGDYQAEIISTEMKATRNGQGQYLEMAFRITEGDYENRRLWTRLNLDNPSAMAVEIAQKELSAICRAVGIMEPGDSSDLHGIPLVIKVRQSRRNDNGELGNVIRGYDKVTSMGSDLAEAHEGQVVTSTEAQITTPNKPWLK